MRWFAARTFYRTAPVGRPRRPDQYYLRGIAAVEERIVLFRAKNGAAALRRAKAEGRKYASTVGCLNRYGQRVVTSLLRGVEAYELDERPSDATETFSAIQIVSAGERAAAIVPRRLGRAGDPCTAHMFVAGEIAAELERRSVKWPVKPANRRLERPDASRRADVTAPSAGRSVARRSTHKG